jgi:membrane protease subunit HflK
LKVKIMTQDFMVENPWGNPGSSRPASGGQNGGQPSDTQPRKPTNLPPTWDAVLRNQRGGRGGGNGGGGQGGGQPPFFGKFQKSGDIKDLPLGPILLIVGALWLAGGVYRVQPEEHAIITRFGRYTETVEKQGLNYRLPWPVEDAQKVNVTFERRIEIGYTGQRGARLDKPDESQMLTGDANIVDLDFVVQWKVNNARDFAFNIRHPENTIKKVAESAMREVVGQNALQDIITDGREDVASTVRQTMQSILDSYKAGVSITQVLIQDASVPQPVLDAFEDVIRATQEAETKKNQGIRYRNEIVPRAQGEAIRLTKEAEAYKEQVVSRANGEAKRFLNVYSAYKQAPAVTRERLYIQAIQDVLQKSDKMLIDQGSGSNTVPYLDLNALRRNNTSSTQTQDQ